VRTELVAIHLSAFLICSVNKESHECFSIISLAAPPPEETAPSDFMEVLHSWGSVWLWDNLKISGGLDWVYDAIRDESLISVCDGSFLRQLYPNLCSAALVLECTKGRGRLVVSFVEKSSTANAYRGELLGLMAVHLLLLAFNMVRPNLTGSVHLYTDCLGALKRVRDLSPDRIPSRCCHADILKNILVNSSNLSFTRYFSHVKAHQNDEDEWINLTRPSQLNCGCDAAAKNILQQTDPPEFLCQKAFPLEPIILSIGGNKITSETSSLIRFETHWQEA